jgi:hypothetical protein
MLCLVAVFGKVQSTRLARLSGLLGVTVIGAMGLIGWGRSSAWITPAGPGHNFSLSYLRQRLPSLPETLYDGGWASPDILRDLTLARPQYPAQVKIVDRYLAAWRFWHKDVDRGEAALWRLGMQDELVEYYANHQNWAVVEQIAQAKYLPSVAETLPSSRVEALKALARRSGKSEDQHGARRYLVDAFKNSGRLEVTEQDRLWQQISRSLGQDVSWTEYYQCLQQLSLQSTTPEALGRIFFEMRKLEQLHPEVQRPAAGPASPGATDRGKNI